MLQNVRASLNSLVRSATPTALSAPELVPPVQWAAPPCRLLAARYSEIVVLKGAELWVMVVAVAVKYGLLAARSSVASASDFNSVLLLSVTKSRRSRTRQTCRAGKPYIILQHTQPTKHVAPEEQLIQARSHAAPGSTDKRSKPASHSQQTILHSSHR
jgi:hypothetical protein